MKLGDLLSLVRNEKDLNELTLLDMARQAAAGMVYLSDKNIVHRDLALSTNIFGILFNFQGNFLVASNNDRKYTIKVSDVTNVLFLF